MYVEETSNGCFAIQDLTIGELELLQESLITYKQVKLQDPEVFKFERRSCIEIYDKIDAELIKSKTTEPNP